MSKPRRVSIGTLCVLVAVAAVDVAWWRHLSRFSRGLPVDSLLGFRGVALDAPVMMMASVLALGIAYALSNRGRVPRRLVGFLLGGLAGLVLYLAYSWACLVVRQDVVEWSMSPIDLARDWLRLTPLDFDYYFYADIVYFGTPQLLLAAVGALIAGKSKATPDGKDS